MAYSSNTVRIDRSVHIYIPEYIYIYIELNKKQIHDVGHLCTTTVLIVVPRLRSPISQNICHPWNRRCRDAAPAADINSKVGRCALCNSAKRTQDWGHPVSASTGATAPFTRISAGSGVPKQRGRCQSVPPCRAVVAEPATAEREKEVLPVV